MPAKRFGAVSKHPSAIEAKAARLAGEGAGPYMQAISRELEDPFSEDQGLQMQIPVAMLDPDPDNPRHLKVTLELLRQGGSTDPDLSEDVDEIQALAQSMREIGQQEAMKVYERGGRYTLVTGERRYWALQLAGIETAEVKLLRDRPSRVALVQHTENVVRKNFRLREELLSLERVVSESENTPKPVQSAAAVRNLGYADTTSKRWWRVLQGPGDVRQAVLDRQVVSLKVAAAAAVEPSPERRKQILAGAGESTSSAPASPAVRTRSPRKGRPAAVVSFGKTRDLSFAKVILLRLHPQLSTGVVDWADAGAVAKCARTIFKNLEREFAHRGGS